MSGQSALREYLQTVQIQWKQIRDVLEDIKRPHYEDTGTQPPERNSDALRTLFKRAAAEVALVRLFDEVNPWLEELQYRHEGLVEEAWDCRKRRAWWRLEWGEAGAAWEEVDRRVAFVEARLEALKEAKSPETGQTNTPARERITFDDATMTITLDTIPHTIANPRAYAIVKLLHTHRGDLVTSDEIRSKIRGLKGKNAVSAKINSLPEAIRECIKGQPGEGYYFCLPVLKPKGEKEG